MKRNTENRYRPMLYAALCLALCMVLPSLTGHIPQIGNMISPMHIPVFLAGFLCGPWWAAAVGFIAPLLRFALFGMPPIFPTGISMCAELAVYGLVSGLLYRILPKKVGGIYLSLIAAMLAGRVAWGIMRLALSGIAGQPFTWAAFMAGAFINAVPAIILHLILVPAVVLLLQRAHLLDDAN